MSHYYCSDILIHTFVNYRDYDPLYLPLEEEDNEGMSPLLYVVQKDRISRMEELFEYYIALTDLEDAREKIHSYIDYAKTPECRKVINEYVNQLDESILRRNERRNKKI